MEIQTRVAPAELWLRDDLENIFALLFRFLGFGFRLARDAEVRHSGARSHRLPPRPALLDEGEPCDICQYTSFRPLFAGLFVTPRNKDDMGDGVPTDQLSHNHCDCTDSHCKCHIVLRVCLCFLLSHLLSQGHRRQKQLSDFVKKKKYWTLPKSCGSQVSEPEERKKSRGKRGSLCARRRSRKTVTCHGLRVVEPVYIRPHCAADGGTGGELRGRAILVTVDVLTGHICSVSLCLYVPTERDKYVLCVCWCWCWCVTLTALPCPHSSPCVYVQNTSRVYIRNVPVCTCTTPTSVTTCGRGAGTHGDVLNVHTRGFQRATPHRTHTPRPQRHTHKTTTTTTTITTHGDRDRETERHRERQRKTDKTRRQDKMKEERQDRTGQDEKREERRDKKRRSKMKGAVCTCGVE